MYYHKNRLIKYENNEKYYDFDTKLRLLNLELLEKIELNFKNQITIFFELKDNFKNKELYKEKYLEKTLIFIENKIKELKKEDKDIKKEFKNTGKISTFSFIDKLTFGEIVKIFRHLKTKYKKEISNKYNLNYKKNLPSQLESEAWKVLVQSLYSKIMKKSNLFGKNFWQEQIKEKGKLCFLAPMDGYGDSAYRQTMRKIAPHVCLVSEFYSSDGLVMSKFLADSVLPHEKIEDPLVIQIFGKNPEMFAKAAKKISEKKYNIAGIDVNMGCPAKKVVRSGHGSSLMINEETSYEIIKALDEATSLPISVKTRLSFDGGQDLIKFGKNLEKAGCKLLTVHGRTAKQAYTGTANLEPIYALQKELKIPVIANGDIMNFKDGMEKVKNLAGFMIGRGSFGNPWCFLGEQHNPKNILDPEEKKKYSHLNPNNFVDGVYYPSLSEILDIMDFHAKALVETKGEKKGSLEIRKHLVQYLKHFPGVKKYRKRLVTTDSYENSKNIISEIREDFKEFLDRRPALGEI